LPHPNPPAPDARVYLRRRKGGPLMADVSRLIGRFFDWVAEPAASFTIDSSSAVDVDIDISPLVKLYADRSTDLEPQKLVALDEDNPELGG
ncbi:MAG: hypothetical protein ACF8TS_08495, partial [Maioricimonas sp. JB049]